MSGHPSASGVLNASVRRRTYGESCGMGARSQLSPFE
jgi:hypothetical protein